ncbi:hypothetical protein H340_13586 [Streptomyces mobaraensis NBRC 13819 = DSM 40847]|uniref:MvdD-like pre-ATP grasp domain-containing protein n=1 Tax=Streptomyces mobaraensis (strain ATCC 29032 / DSM 40847 / JCM 4168 / NBRC 13819 / NCIMB 11159 / IPCR 16-22) TaxID=1223523 RepID=M3B254_STRM1|nr:hypothetical protein H340_13586 [Streptomyces mobaraensis NBRC 13819 = DSM 40847]
MTDPRPVAVVTNLDDPTADLVIAELHDRGVPVVRFDSGDFPATLACSAFIGGKAQQWHGSVQTPTRTAELGTVRSLYYRRPSGFAFPHLDVRDARFAVAQARYGLGGVLASLPGCLYVNHPHRIGDAEYKPAGLAAAAHLFQAQVDKAADVHVTVVGERVFAVRVDSGLLDWRIDYSTHTYTPVVPPPDVRSALFAYLRHFGLVFGAFDFALTPSGEWTFIECNPSGQWAWMEPPTGLP